MSDETEIIGKLASKLVTGEIKTGDYYSLNFLHHKWGKIDFKMGIIKISSEESAKEKFAVEFTVSSGNGSYCSQWISSGSFDDQIKFMENIQDNPESLVNQLKDFYRSLFEISQ